MSMKDASCQTEDNESRWKNHPKSLTNNECAVEKDTRSAKRRNLRVLVVKGDDCEVLSVMGNLAVNT